MAETQLAESIEAAVMAAKQDFSEGTRYALTVRDADGRQRPANVYVFRLHDDFMVVRNTAGDGLLRKLGYDEVQRIVSATPAAPSEQLSVPDAMLQATFWKDRQSCAAYGSSPARGK